MSEFKFCPNCGDKLVATWQQETPRQRCQQCRRIWYRNPTIGVAVVIVQQGELLLVRRRSGNWCIPCGHVEWNEDVERAAKRELQEETGLNAEIDRVYSVQSNFHDADHHTVGVWFLGTVLSGCLHVGDDAIEARYWSLNAMPSLEFPTDRNVVRQLQTEFDTTATDCTAGDAVRQVVKQFRDLAAEKPFPVHVQHALGSESAYLRIKREGHWFGLRVSTHVPVHSSSKDFAQLIIPVAARQSAEFAHMVEQRLRRFIERGGFVVADPEEAEREVQMCFVNSGNHEQRSRRRLPTTAEICAVRHRLNIRARWTFEMESDVDDNS